MCIFVGRETLFVKSSNPASIAESLLRQLAPADIRPQRSFSMGKQTQAQKQPAQKSQQNEVAVKVISVNRQAYHDYTVERTVEAGVSLVGTEIKSIREGKVNLRSSYAIIRQGEVWLENAHIAVYDFGNRFNHDPMRKRKLLLHRREIQQLEAKVATKGLTLIPLKLYLKGGHAKIELGLCRGKKLYDKREAIAERDVKREMERIVRRG
jgi:SsrA-binding protein